MRSWLDSLRDTLQVESSKRALKSLRSWKNLRLFLIYRITLSLALLFFFFSKTGPDFLGQHSTSLFAFSATLYMGLVMVGTVFWYWRSPKADQQAAVMVFIDILAITLLMHASGGIESGLGILIAISITSGSVMMGGRASLLFAALASLMVITDQIYASLTHVYPTRFIQAGFLGSLYFTMALIAHVFSRRIGESEKLAEQRARQLENMARLNDHVIQHIQTGVLVVDQHLRILLINAPARRLLGTPDAAIGSPLKRASKELTHMLIRWKQDHNRECPPFRINAHGPELKPRFNALEAGADGRVLVFLEDHSRLIVQAQQMKLASLGRLTASIAHEIRNPLGALSHASQLFDESPDLNPADRRLIEIIQSNSQRVNQVIENVLQLSRRDPGKPRAIPLTAWLRDFISEQEQDHELPPGVFSLQVEPESINIIADPGQLRQIVTNLCNNAREHASREQPLRIRIIGGKVTEFDDPVVDIIDNGPGIPREVARQIFEPFYTTHNKGTGLGLYIAKELSEANRIELEYIPGPTGGSCFRLHFYNWNHEVS
ncbi:sensor histidine kinase [endosymbiont of Ridgeia piscesae]|jgi:two-component system sensor histidine kinase PilS (NtrC family)|uniref:histidine kinase n=1 Tax=endosymbiont of Ridgeia piscesae TaxID=54398 RepID=A0A0T5YWS6_9GAMM|nr:ATP-binding protein [endosymbiont of Ridgeia piscesae]KRT55092.1 two-component system sensor histidine kinase PilS [endosymbiont of Ridgeia piscesae]KRT57032.1 two-component system, NtrC family, sensor histidine kinase PilS [endosymbiont of Ridgeia piscesae]